MSTVGLLGFRRGQLRGRPELYTSYAADMALLNTPGKRFGVLAIVLMTLLIPLNTQDHHLLLLATAFVAGIGAIGLNLVSGYAGQVSLGHAFFIGLGAYTAAILGGDPDGRALGLGLDMLVWLPAAGVVAAAAGAVVAPLATRLRGLYLAVVTLGLVFLGEHIFKEAKPLTGGLGVGRAAAPPEALGYSFNVDGPMLGLLLTREQKVYYLMLGMLCVAAVVGRNLARSAVGRAFQAIRDRDIAAEVIGVGVTRYKLLAFTISSFYAGIAGALLYSILGVIEPGSFDLLLSIRYIAMVLIGGAATISGSIMGALFITLLRPFIQLLPRFVPFVSAQPTGAGGLVSTFQLEAILYGLLIVGFLIFEPRGLYGTWIRIRNYWKGWPFSY